MLGQYLKNYRLAHNLSQDQMAAKLGTSQSYYSRIESDRQKPGIKLIGKISNELGKSPMEIRSYLDEVHE